MREIPEQLAFLYERAGDFSYPGGSFFDFVRDELEILRAAIEPPRPPRKPPKRRIPAATRKRIFERDGYRCVGCGSWIDLTIDHRVPESRGGSDDDENLQTMCLRCNLAKGTK